MVVASPNMELYFKGLEEKIDEIYEIARKARSLGLDPELEPEIPRAEDLAARVEKLVGPPGVVEVIRRLEKELPREELALKIAEMIVDGKFGEFGDSQVAEQAVRTSLAIITEGIASAAPLEGITHIEIRKNFDGSPYLALYFAGPIRSAGGTAAALAVLTGDFVRRKLYLSAYKPTDDEIERFVEEVDLYATDVAHLQYTPPSQDDIRTAVRNIPVEITGEPTERDITVTAYRDLKRIGHNLVRGGAVLALVEGVLQKAPKILKHVNKLNIDGWGWLSELVTRVPSAEEAGPIYPKGEKYLEEIIAGRPVLSYPGREGGFRLRYGRARNTGIAAAGIHPATMVILDDFLAVGTQLKIERPGKGAAVAPVDTIEGPIIKLVDGSVVQVNSVEQALELRDKVSEILFLGDILLGYGEFLENNHPLMPTGYSEDWWAQEVKRALTEKQMDVDLSPYLAPFYQKPSPQLAIEISEKLGVSLHPVYTYHFHDITIEELKELGDWLSEGEPEFEGGSLRRLRVKIDPRPKHTLEALGVPHRVEDGHVVIEDPALPLCMCLGLLEGAGLTNEKLNSTIRSHPTKDTIDVVQVLAGFPVRRKAPTRIGCRMGRPEKANPRIMSPPVHVLFPVSLRGGATRSVVKAAEGGEVFVEVARLECPECGSVALARKCPKCGATAGYTRICTRCGRPASEERCLTCDAPTAHFDQRRVDLKSLFNGALQKLGEPSPDEVKGVRGMTSAYKIPEPLEKGILRAKHSIYVFKDGTVRFDATDLPLTHFRPREVGTSVERLRELGYTNDCDGKPLERDDQVVELKVQDVLLSRACAEYLLRASKFVDELLQKFYGLPSFYNATWPGDLVGHLVIGLAPHTSAGMVGRIIGFMDANVGYAHPYFHAAKRRNCFDPDTTIVLYDKKNDELFTCKIGDFVEKMIRENGAAAEDVNITNDRYRAVSFDPNTRDLILAGIAEFQRRRAPDRMLEITIEGNKKIRVTPDHKALVYRDGQLMKLEARDIKEGDAVPSAMILPELVEQINTTNLAKELVERKAISPEKLIFRDADSLASDFLALGFKLQSLVEKTGYDYRYIQGALRSGKVHMALFLAALSEGLINWEAIPKGAKLGIIRDDVAVPAIISLTNEFARILGYYLSEGHAHANRTTWQLVFDPWDEKILDDLRHCVKEVFRLSVVPDKNKKGRVTLCSRIVYHLFMNVLEIGKNAHEKRVPAIVFKMPEPQLAHFLKAYFCGDGYKAPNQEIRFTSVNKTLLEGVALALLRLGIRSRFVYPKPRYPGQKVQQRYRELGLEVPKFAANVLIILRKNNEDFMEKIGAEVPVLGDGGLEEVVSGSKVKKIRVVKTDEKFVYCLTVSEKSLHNLLLANGVIIGQCDGDEDAVMLLLDALLNFSKRFLPSTRGGTMDAPLVLTTRLDPAEIDEEAHNMDVMAVYPLEFYEATLRCANPGELLTMMETVKRRLGTEAQYEGLRFSRDTSYISSGPHSSRYKTLETMIDKTASQLSLARKIRAVDERDVAERLIEHHFIPDLKGNLRAFSSQQFRCISCNAKHRRVPLSGVCGKCGGKLVLTVTRGGVEKYLQVAMQLAQEYGASDYTKQRLKLVQRDIRSVFESDAHRQLSLADFL